MVGVCMLGGLTVGVCMDGDIASWAIVSGMVVGVMVGVFVSGIRVGI